MLNLFIGSFFMYQVLSDAFSFPTPQPHEIISEETLWATEYHIHRSAHVSNGYPLLDKNGVTLGFNLGYNDWCAAALEGTTGVLMPNKNVVVVNVDDEKGQNVQVDCSSRYPSLPPNVRVAMGKARFKFPQGPYGNGYEGHILQPYRTLAADLTRYPLRTLVYVPEARGLKIPTPSGEIVHDGYFFTADKGGAIKGNHIDVFIGLSEKNPFPFVKSMSNKTFKAYLIQNPTISDALLQTHLPTP